ncbi:hypothetical protein O3M35_005961 [Rhynocoris fuscipes]|uniref:Uncharacterized protein n=1 Tax=Rhynocoris fuscipes TaxID=488301 RepID=A0AAW1DE63_9HEMI
MIKYFTTNCSWSKITNIQSARWYIYVEFISDIVTVISAPRGHRWIILYQQRAFIDKQ